MAVSVIPLIVLILSLLLLKSTVGVAQSCIGSSQYNATFNELNNTFYHPHDFNSSNPVGNLTLYIKKQFFIEKFGIKTSSICLNFSFPVTGFLETEDNLFPIDNDAVLEVGSQNRLWTPQMMNGVTISSAEYTECMSGNTTYFSIPVAFLLQKGPRVVGIRRWVIDLLTIGSGEMSMLVENFNTINITVIANPVEMCKQLQLLYLFENNTCVKDCPCYLKTFSTFCFEYSSAEFGQATTDVSVTANFTNGHVATIDVLLDQSALTLLELTIQYTGVRGDRMHDEQPTVNLTVSPSNLEIMLHGNNYFLPISNASLNSSTLENCDKYKILPLQFNLVSSSFYQLGEHIIKIIGIFSESIEFETQLVVNVETNTTCTDDFIDLSDQQCVSECSCGFVPFRSTATPYCEPAGMARPARLEDDQLRVEVEEGTAINESVRLYTGPMFMIYNLKPLPSQLPLSLVQSTDSVSVLLGIEQVSSSTLQPSLYFDGEVGPSLNISLNNTYLSSRGLEHCDEEPNSYITITIVLPKVSKAGEYSFDIVTRFTSTVNEIENDLRNADRPVNVTQVLRVDLEVTSAMVSTSVPPTMPSVSPTVSSVPPTMHSVVSSVPPTMPSVSPTVSSVPPTMLNIDIMDQVIAIISGLTIFTPVKEMLFQKIVADSLNIYCRTNQDECRSMNRRQVITVQPDDVVTLNITNIDKGIQLYFYVVRMGGGVIPPQVVLKAVQANLQSFINAQLNVEFMLAVPRGIEYITIAVVVSVFAALLLLAAVVTAVILVVIFLRYKSHSDKKEFPKQELAIMQK